MCAEVYKHQRIETGGDLFGLWTTSGDVVIHAALGPGKNCRRTGTSFHQDIQYLERVGHFLNENYMLCHVGEWHSHHQLSLDEPSAGDESTVWNNYPAGMKKFLVIIGNLRIRAPDDVKVTLSPYIFIHDVHKCVKGELKVLDTNSPFTSDSIVAEEMRKGSEAEAQETGAHQPGSRIENHANSQSRLATDASRMRSEAERNGTGNNWEGQSRRNVNSSNNNLISFDNDIMTQPNNIPEQRVPPRDYENFPKLPVSPAQENKVVSSVQLILDNPRSSNVPTSSDQTDSKQTKRETIIKEVHDKIISIFQSQKVDMVGLIEGDATLTFKHNYCVWLIFFPQNFPAQPARIQKGSEHLSLKTVVAPPHPMTEASLNNYVNILLAIRSNCCCSKHCWSRTNDSWKKLVNPESDINLFLTQEGSSFVQEFSEKVQGSIADPGSLKQELVVDTKNPFSVEEPVVKISFKHAGKIWIIRLTSTFPTHQAKASYIDEEVGGGKYEKPFQFSTRDKNSVAQILLAITRKCQCQKCKHVDIYKESAVLV